MTFSEFFRKLTSRYLWGHLLAMVVTAVVGLVGLYYFLDFYTNHGEAVAVPDVRGQQCDVAIRKLEAAGLRVEVSDTGYMPTKTGGIILDQHLRPGTLVKANRLVRLTVNASSAKTLALPDLADNCSLREARMRLQALGFRIGAPKRITGDRDWVYGMEVGGKERHAGERVPINLPVILVVGDGASEEEFNGNDSLDYLYFNEDSVIYEEVPELPE